MSTLSDRNNNPLNIRTSGDDWKGASGSNAGFVKFNNPEYGVRAGALNLYASQEKHGNNSVRDIITRWAPPSENDTEAYVQRVSNDLGVSPDDNLGSLRDNPDVTTDLLSSMAKHEGATVGSDGKYTQDVIENGVAMANGKPASEVDFANQNTDFAAAGFTPEADSSSDAIKTTEANEIKKIGRAEQQLTSGTNWMSTVDSPTYRWTLYIVNNEIWNDPNLIGDNDSSLTNNKAFIIAKQGVDSEFSVDNFMSLAAMTPGQKHGNATPGIIQFDLFENLGFSFIDKILSAGKQLGKPSNLYSQNFLLKLEFLGRNQVNNRSVKFPGVYLYPVKFNQIRSTTGPEGTRYNIIAWSALKHAQTEGVTDSDITVSAITTIGDFIKGLEKEYNDGITDLMAPSPPAPYTPPPKEIKIVFDTSAYYRGGSTQNDLRDFNLESKPFGSTADASSSTRYSQDGPGSEGKNIYTIERETNIAMAIQKTIENNCYAWDKWVDEAHKKNMVPHIVVESRTEYPPHTKKSNYGHVEPTLVIYTIKISINKTTYQASLADGDEALSDQTKQVKRFKTLGIEKSYSFMYTGLNTEVINYQIDIQNLYFVLDEPGAGLYVNGTDAEGKQQFAPTTITDSIFLSDIKQAGGSETYFNQVVGGVAKNESGEGQQSNEINTSAQSTIARRMQKMAKREYDAINFTMEIKGDPHWMGNMQAIVKGKLETPDYAKQDALITFIQFNPNADRLLTEQIKGEVDPISTGVYKLTTVESRFQGGRFTQTLNGYKDVNSNTSLLINQILELSGD